MTTQKEVLESVREKGYYSASVYLFNSRTERGRAETRPAIELTKKGLLTLKSETVETSGTTKITRYCWVAAHKE